MIYSSGYCCVGHIMTPHSDIQQDAYNNNSCVVGPMYNRFQTRIRFKQLRRINNTASS